MYSRTITRGHYFSKDEVEAAVPTNAYNVKFKMVSRFNLEEACKNWDAAPKEATQKAADKNNGWVEVWQATFTVDQMDQREDNA